MEGGSDDKIIAYMIERDECQGPVYYQKWYGMKPTTPIISGGMNALRLPGFFQNLGHGNVINTSGGGSYGHIDSPAAGAISCVNPMSAGNPVLTRLNLRKSTKNLLAHSSHSLAMLTSCSQAGAKSWAYTSKPQATTVKVGGAFALPTSPHLCQESHP